MKVAIGIKKGMTRVFKGEKSVPVTVVDISECVVANKDDRGVEVGYGKVKAGKALLGKYKKLGYVPMHRKYVSGDWPEVNIGDAVKSENFISGLKVSVVGVTKGKGFAGVVKRWGFHGGPKTHGQSDKWRSPGSIGAGTTPGRIQKGLRMSGRMGGERKTLNNLEIVDVVDNYLLISGPLPGSVGKPVLVIAQ